MIDESQIIFITTTLYTKWLNYQQAIIKKLFPLSEVILVNGETNWPNSWFYWIDIVKKSNKKYYIHIDEDFFITSKEELIKAIELLELKNIDILGCPDGYHHFRGANPVAINSFLMIGKIDVLKKLNIDLKSGKYSISMVNGNYNFINSFNLKFKDSYKDGFEYNFKKQSGCNFNNEQEPYYAFMWAMKDIGCKFGYLYPSFNEKFKSTNPRISENSNDIGIHMWYTRQWDSKMDVWGMPNIERYNLLEKHLNE